MPEPSKGPSPALLTAVLVLVGLGLVLLAAGLTGPVDAATFALAACGAALVYALRRLFAVVRALARPDALARVGRGAGHFSQAELRDEKRRLLRAIKELEFDHGMGKLSQQDFDAVIGTYRLRAIEVMRAQGSDELHADLRRLLAERERPAESATPAPAPAPAPAARTTEEMAAALPRVEAERPRSPTESQPPADILGSFERTARICPSCVTNNDSDARFCKQCGASLVRRSDPPRELRGGSSSSGEIGA